MSEEFISSKINILDESYEVLDALENITLADSIIKDNKIGSGHGEGKLYVGNVTKQHIKDFFGDFQGECFFVGNDFIKYLQNAKDEYYNPQQPYVNKNEMRENFSNLESEASKYKNAILNFKIFCSEVQPPRIYINSNSEYYLFMRRIGLPNISYVSILKLKSKTGKIYYYYKMFLDYKSDILKYNSPIEISELKNIEDNTEIKAKEKERLIKARIGQGMYREKLLEDCMYCPFTMVNDERLLIASHIKPWAKSNDKEKVDCKNGFILTPTYDKLFDQGFISFSDDKRLIVSPWLSPMNQKRLGIYQDKFIDKLPLDNKRIIYLAYHRIEVYKN
ncbi:HNH endonuclease [Propionispira raffinosivorans]|uniref:HNH endonuclease n=1 Tax=Propionispira raffinosivorans TaxID=86959 RepID=UPI000373C8D9|nr:HNH endonuclease [Propionispira raffinosivorans]